MDWLLVPAGTLLVLVGLLDVFPTVPHYDGVGFPSSLYERIFGTVRLVTRPTMVPATITGWISLVSLGYAPIYLHGMRNRDFSLSVGRPEPSFAEAFYFSGTAISTLGDISPTLYQVLSVSGALTGFGILMLSITHVLGVYNVLRQRGVVTAGLYTRPGTRGTPGASWPALPVWRDRSE